MSGAPILGFEFPNFDLVTSKGNFKFHDYLGDGWGILFSHPADYTPVCTTELGMVEKYHQKFTERGVKLIALSCNDVESHHGWIKDIIASQGLAPKTDLSYPIIADPDRKLALELGMIDPDEIGAAGLPMSARVVFIINPAKKLALSILYPATTGRNFDEILRVVDSLKLTAEHKVATPANWTGGQNCMVVPSISDEEAASKFPSGFQKATVPSGKGYLRTTPDPRATI